MESLPHQPCCLLTPTGTGSSLPPKTAHFSLVRKEKKKKLILRDVQGKKGLRRKICQQNRERSRQTKEELREVGIREVKGRVDQEGIGELQLTALELDGEAPLEAGCHTWCDRGQLKPDWSSTDRMLKSRQLAEARA